jgi:D-alanyl-D-alanine carboxypeptidase (penicillin-binding protein 5/6)
MKRHILTTILWLISSHLFFLNTALAGIIPEELISSKILPEISAESWVLLEPETAWIIAEKDADKRIEPASMTKLMTTYVAFDLLDQGRLNLQDKVKISDKARYVEGSRMFAELNSELTVLELLKGVIVQSGNDASIALAEFAAGSEQDFVNLMNEKVKSLNLQNSQFQNVTGLPAENHYSSARDIALISRALIYEFPQFYPWFAIKELTHNKITQSNRNRLLYRADWIDGLKTGHTEAAGYCLAASGKQGNTRFIVVVTNTSSDKERMDAAYNLLKYGFANYELFASDMNSLSKSMTVSGGAADQVDVFPSTSIRAVLPKGYSRENDIKLEFRLEDFLVAPISKGDSVGIVRMKYKDVLVATSSMQTKEGVELGSLFKRIVDSVKRLL